MNGINGFSKTAAMPSNCGMKDMHGDMIKKFSLPDTENLAVQPKKNDNNIKIKGLGENIDLKV